MSVADSGTHTSTDGTEVQASEKTTGGVYVAKADLSNLTADDVVVIRVYDKVLSGGSYAVWSKRTYSGVQAEPVVASDPLPVDQAIKLTFQQTAGATYRAIPWALHSV